MAEYVTKKELENVLDSKFTQYQVAILEAVSFQREETKKEISDLQNSVQNLTITLDNFLKRLTDREDEFILLKAEVDHMKSVFKEKFGVEISAQG